MKRRTFAAVRRVLSELRWGEGYIYNAWGLTCTDAHKQTHKNAHTKEAREDCGAIKWRRSHKSRDQPPTDQSAPTQDSVSRYSAVDSTWERSVCALVLLPLWGSAIKACKWGHFRNWGHFKGKLSYNIYEHLGAAQTSEEKQRYLECEALFRNIVLWDSIKRSVWICCKKMNMCEAMFRNVLEIRITNEQWAISKNQRPQSCSSHTRS